MTTPLPKTINGLDTARITEYAKKYRLSFDQARMVLEEKARKRQGGN